MAEEKTIYYNEIHCNACGRKLAMDRNTLIEDALIVKKDWGYFSKKDLRIHEFVLCEECYDKMIERFTIPVTISDKDEVLD